jgi:heme exporter protein C
MSRFAVPVFAVLAALGIVTGIFMVFMKAPLQYAVGADGSLEGSSLFFNQKIFYFHVAHAFWLFAAVFVSGVASIVFLKTRNARWDDIASAAAEVAVAFGAVVLVTGSIWAKAAWDVWWKLEPRLTLSLLLWLILLGYVLVRRFAGATGDRIAAGMAIFGMVGVPFIYTMVNKGDSHPQAGSKGVVATLGAEYRITFALSVAAFLCWFIALVVYRVQSVRAERELRELRELALDRGVLS